MMQTKTMMVGSNGQVTVWRFPKSSDLEVLAVQIDSPYLNVITRSEKMKVIPAAVDSPITAAVAIAEASDPSAALREMLEKGHFKDVSPVQQFGSDEAAWFELVTPAKEKELKAASLSNKIERLEF